MHLRHLLVKNCKLMRELDVSFLRADGSPRLWTVFVGENGTCKTTLLRTIAMAAAGSAFANNLVNDAPAYLDRRRPEASLRVHATFGFAPDFHELRRYPLLDAPPTTPPHIAAVVGADPPGPALTLASWYEHVGIAATEVFGEARKHLLPHWFIAAYGVGRVLAAPLAATTDDVPARDRMRSLFDQRHLPVGTGFNEVLASILDDESAGSFSACLRSALVDRMQTPRMRDVDLAPAPTRGGAEKVFKANVRRHPGLMYYIKNGDVWAVPRKAPGESKGRATKVVASGIEMDYSQYLYFLDGDGDIVRKPRQVGSGRAAVDRHAIEMVSGTGSLKLPAIWLSQGYQAVVSLVADIIGNVWFEAGDAVPLDDMEGIVLVDELDLHIHPTWQASIVAGLKRAFPRMQFIVTTHSPLVLAGCHADEVWKLKQDEATGDVTAEQGEVSPMLLTASEMFREYFGVARTYASELGESLRRYVEIASNPYRSDPDDETMAALKRHLVENRVDVDYEPVGRKTAS